MIVIRLFAKSNSQMFYKTPHPFTINNIQHTYKLLQTLHNHFILLC